MSTKQTLKDQQTQLVLQRAGLKDQLEQNERQLGAVSFALQSLEAVEKEQAEVPEPAPENPNE